MLRALYVVCFLCCLGAGFLIAAQMPLYAMALVLTSYIGAKSFDGIDKS